MKRIVIKIGTNVLEDNFGKLDYETMESLVEDISKISNQGKDVILVTSGAIGAGMAELNLAKKPRDIKMKQACAAIGQSIIMSKYKEFFNKNGIKVAQILITYDDFSDRKRYLNLRNSLNTLLDLKAVPIINENDPISINEIGQSFGDNDRLSALVASKIEADALYILTIVDGLYDKDPKYKDAKIVKEVFDFDKIRNLKGKSSMLGIGGISTKINAAKIAASSGILVIIANGKRKNIISDLIAGRKLGTIFYPSTKISSKKRWIKLSKSRGGIIIDQGAKIALLNGKNLLPAGIINVQGNFGKDDIVDIISDKKIFAKIITDINAEDTKSIMGKKSSEIQKLLNRKIHNIAKRENLVFME